MTNRLIDPQLLERPLAFEWPRLRTKLRVALLACISAVVIIIPPAAQASETECVGALTGGTYDDVVVPRGADCRMTGVTVRGNVTVLPTGSIWVSRSSIGGNLIGDKARHVWIDAEGGPSTVGGNVQVTEGRGDHLPAWICGTEVAGNVQVEKNEGPFVTVGGPGFGGCTPNDVGGNVIAIENTLSPGFGYMAGAMQVNGNLVGGNLQIFKNKNGGGQVQFNVVPNGVIQCYENAQIFAGSGNVGRAPDQPPPFMAGRNQCSGTST